MPSELVRTRDRRASRPRRATIAALGALLITALTVTALDAWGSPPTMPSTTERFLAAVDSAGRSHELLTMANVVRSGWDQGVVVCPDDPVDAVESLLGARWRDAPSTADDGVAYVVFATGAAVVDTVRLDRAAVDPCPETVLLSARSFGPSGVFHVEGTTLGDGWTIGPNG
ncbi:MAG: hypothetical protein ACOH2F_07935 [Cellulomonas sp.]